MAIGMCRESCALNCRARGDFQLTVICAGGHTSEMLKLTAHLDPEIYTPLCYVVASTDSTSAERIPSSGLRAGRCRVCTIPRSREVSSGVYKV